MFKVRPKELVVEEFWQVWIRSFVGLASVKDVTGIFNYIFFHFLLLFPKIIFNLKLRYLQLFILKFLKLNFDFKLFTRIFLINFCKFFEAIRYTKHRIFNSVLFFLGAQKHFIFASFFSLQVIFY